MSLIKKSIILIFLLFLSFFLAFNFTKTVDAQTTSKNCSAPSTGMIPLIDLKTGMYKNFQGGLYPGGLNTPPTNYLNIGLQRSTDIKPLDSAGNPDSVNGKIVLLSVGMSNTNAEFDRFSFKSKALTNTKLVFVNGAQSGKDAANWANNTPDATGKTVWQVVDDKLASQSATVNQVQAIWLKHAVSGIATTFPNDSITLKGYVSTIISAAKSKFPNLQIIYLTSRNYAGYSTVNLSPEPIAYETAFSYKWIIEDNINSGAIKPYIGWGPYFWADGLNPRSDGLIWNCEDFANDGVHPAQDPTPSTPPDIGAEKVADLMLYFFQTDQTAKNWFSANPSAPVTPPPFLIASLLGDLNGDKIVNIFDYAIFVADFNKTGTGIKSDLNNSGKVDIFDYAIFVGNFGKTSP